LDSKLAEILGRQERVVSMLSSNTNQQQQINTQVRLIKKELSGKNPTNLKHNLLDFNIINITRVD
jgi:hypothetical protein